MRALIQSGYVAMFLIFLVDGGPVSIALGGAAAHMSFFDWRAVFLLTVLGNFLPDMAFYAIGYKGRDFAEKHGKRFGVTAERISAIERFYADHPFKTLLAVKMTPLIPIAGLAAAGAAQMPFARYAISCSVIIVVTNAMFFATGYLFGEAYVQLALYQALVIVAAVAVIFLLGRYYPRLAARLGKKINPDLGKIK